MNLDSQRLDAGPSVTKRASRMPFGAQLSAEGVRFRIWAPKHNDCSYQSCLPAPSLLSRQGSAGSQTPSMKVKACGVLRHNST